MDGKVEENFHQCDVLTPKSPTGYAMAYPNEKKMFLGSWIFFLVFFLWGHSLMTSIKKWDFLSLSQNFNSKKFL